MMNHFHRISSREKVCDYEHQNIPVSTSMDWISLPSWNTRVGTLQHQRGQDLDIFSTLHLARSLGHVRAKPLRSFRFQETEQAYNAVLLYHQLSVPP